MTKKKDGYDRLARRLANMEQGFGPCRGLWEEYADILREAFPDRPPKLTKEERAERKFQKEHQKPKFNARISHTFQEWSDEGYRIVKGSHSVSRNKEGIALFIPSQVILSKDIIVARAEDCIEESIPDESECF